MQIFWVIIGTLVTWGAASAGFAALVRCTWIYGLVSVGAPQLAIWQVWSAVVLAITSAGVVRFAWSVPLFEFTRRRDSFTRTITIRLGPMES